MSTITAKELRDNLEDIVKRVQHGEHLRVTYRNKPAFELVPQKPASSHRKPLAGLEAFLVAPKKYSPLDQNKSIKDLYHEHLEEKYGQK